MVKMKTNIFFFTADNKNGKKNTPNLYTIIDGTKMRIKLNQLRTILYAK